MIRPQTQNKGPEHCTFHCTFSCDLIYYSGKSMLIKMIRKEVLPFIYKKRFRKKIKLRYWSMAPYKKSRPSGSDSLTYSYQHMF